MHDPQNPNWWYNQIGVPRLVGSSALLFEDGLSVGARGKVVEILARARWAHGTPQGWAEWTGANLLWIAFNILLRGCIENVPALCEEACQRVYGEIRVAQIGEEGLQADMSFHQHGPLLYNGGYGLAFSENCALFLHLTHGTPWQGSAECLRLFTSFLLEGQQWMIRGRRVSITVPWTREVTRGPQEPRGVHGGRRATRRSGESPAGGPRRRLFAGGCAGRTRWRSPATGITGARISRCTSARRSTPRCG